MANPRGTFTLFKRETMRFLKVYMQTIFAPVVNNLLYFAVFGFSLHRAIPSIQGITYLQFMVPGLIIMGLVNNAYQNPSSSIILMKYQGIIGDLLSIPLKRSEIFLAFIASAVIRSFIVGGVTFLTALFFISFPYTSIPIILISAFLVALFFSFLGLFVGIWAKEFDNQAFIQTFIIMPLTFLGGVFYPITSLPAAMATVAKFDPIVHMINLLRYGFTGLQEIPISLSLIVLASITIFMGLISFIALRTGWKLQN
ncbi:ABC transporter permease [Candidatus Peregrinibacteria bacterium]|nr:ABC transporter permease [Candidatus Peregrinibacteria bacterium]